jgi:hemerythrin
MSIAVEHGQQAYVSRPARLSVGVALMDDQQKQIFDLARSLDNKTGQVRVMHTLSLLNDYVRNHFQEEESLMTESSYPGLNAHRKLHQEFRGMLADLLGRAGRMSLDEIVWELHSLIFEWLYTHIMQDDFEYFPHAASR